MGGGQSPVEEKLESRVRSLLTSLVNSRKGMQSSQAKTHTVDSLICCLSHGPKLAGSVRAITVGGLTGRVCMHVWCGCAVRVC